MLFSYSYTGKEFPIDRKKSTSINFQIETR